MTELLCLVLAGASRTYSVPIERKRVIPTAPRGSGAPFEPEPALDSEAYERALHTCANMAQILEESPSTFANVTETFIRDLLVVMLNDQFTSATRETFRAAGKTDILIDVKGRAIFIAECKFYKGPQSITDALHQLLGYGTWRDTKLALLVFSRHKDFSDVLRKIDESVRGYVVTLANFERRDKFRFGVYRAECPDIAKCRIVVNPAVLFLLADKSP